MASTIKNKPEPTSTSVNANPAIYSLGFLVLFVAIAFALLQLLPWAWFNLLHLPSNSTSNITLALAGFGLGIFALIIIGKNKIFHELPGIKAGIFIAFVLALANLYLDSWWGKFTESLVFDKRAFPESFGMGLAGAGAALIAIGSFIFFFRPANLKLFNRIEEQGWFSRDSFKQNQGTKIRRGTIICLLILFGTGIMVLVRNDSLARNGSNWQIEIPYTGKVKNIMPFGAFVEFMPGKDGLLHISEIKWERLENMEGVLEPGEEIMVKLIDVDKKTGKFKLSRKVLLPKPEKSDKND